MLQKGLLYFEMGEVLVVRGEGVTRRKASGSEGRQGGIGAEMDEIKSGFTAFHSQQAA